jgi:hypothetical protein
MKTKESILAPPGAPIGGQSGPVLAIGAPGGVFFTMKTYSEKLKDPRWQRKRLEILKRDEFTCLSCCDNEKTLHVHHSFYKKGADPWDYEDRHLVTLCEECHGTVESERSELLKLCVHPDMLWEILKMARAASTGHFELISYLSIILNPPQSWVDSNDDGMIQARKRCAQKALKILEQVVDEIGKPEMSEGLEIKNP